MSEMIDFPVHFNLFMASEFQGFYSWIV